MTDVYYGTGCPEEVRDIFEFLRVEVEYEVSRFRVEAEYGLAEDKTRYWKRRAYDIMELNSTTKIRRE